MKRVVIVFIMLLMTVAVGLGQCTSEHGTCGEGRVLTKTGVGCACVVPTPQTTHIVVKGITLGSSVAEFATKVGFDLEGCRAKQKGLNKNTCKGFLAAADNGAEMHFQAQTANGIVSVTLEQGELAELSFVETSFENVTDDLTARYGAPTTHEIVTYQNGFGASWQLPRNGWVLPTGEMIVVKEERTPELQSLGVHSMTEVTFYSKKLSEQLGAADRNRKNTLD